MYEQTKVFEIEVSLHQDSAFSLFFFTLILDTLSECLREGLPWKLLPPYDLVVIAEKAEKL